MFYIQALPMSLFYRFHVFFLRVLLSEREILLEYYQCWDRLLAKKKLHMLDSYIYFSKQEQLNFNTLKVLANLISRLKVLWRCWESRICCLINWCRLLDSQEYSRQLYHSSFMLEAWRQDSPLNWWYFDWTVSCISQKFCLLLFQPSLELILFILFYK